MVDGRRALPAPGAQQSGVHALATDASVNVGDSERWLSLAVGGLLGLGLLRRSLGTVVLTCGAGALLYRGWRGQCALYQTMGLSTAAHDAQPESRHEVTAPAVSPRIVLAGS